MEICINNAWGTVCNRLFGPEDAATACEQLGGFYRESKYIFILLSVFTSCNYDYRWIFNIMAHL